MAKEKFKPDFFLYENNKSAAQAIKDQIKKELGVEDDFTDADQFEGQLDLFSMEEEQNTHKARYIEINSALVSAQNRQRFYVHNCGDVHQPKDRGILLKDILETGVIDREKSRAIIASCGRTTEREYFAKHQGQVALEQLAVEPLDTTEDGKANCLTASYYKGDSPNHALEKSKRPMVAVRIPEYGIEDKSRPLNYHYGHNATTGPGSLEDRMFSPNPKKQQVDLIAEPVKCLSEAEMDYMVRDTNGKYSDRWSYLQNPNADKAKCITANISKGVPYNVLAEPVNVTDDGKSQTIKAQYYKNGIANFVTNTKETTGSSFGATGVAEPVRVGSLPRPNGELSESQGMRIYSVDGKSVTLKGNAGGMGAKTGLYAYPTMPVAEATAKGFTEIEVSDCVDLTQPNSKTRRGRNMKDKSNCLTHTGFEYYQYLGTKKVPVYEVKDGQITVKGKQYPIKLLNGYYIIRKLTVTECCRLQTMPDHYCDAVSDSQAYKGLGNGWTAEVIIHILSEALKDIPKDEEIVVLSMYDGIGTGRYVLDKMGFTNVTYYAYEIDKYAMKIAKSNYPDIIELGDAYQVLNEDWALPERNTKDVLQ